MVARTELLPTPEVVAHAARLSSVQLVAYAQDSSFRVVEALRPLMQCEYVESEFPITTALGASAGEKRVFVSLAVPDVRAIREAAAQRMPIVIFAASRTEDVMALRDLACVIVFCESHQELLDTLIRSFKLCQDSKVLLPCVVAWDGPLNYMEPLLLPSDHGIKNFIRPLRLPHRLEIKNPSHLDADAQTKQHYKAMESVFKIAASVDETWKKKFKRTWPAVEQHRADDAELVLVTYGYHASTAKAAVNTLRSQGKKVGLVRVRLFRPFPKHALSVLAGKKVAVLDFAASPGAASPLYSEIKPLSKLALSFVSLGKYLSEKDFLDIFDRLDRAEKEEMFWI